jgi:predicted chitinase
MHQRTTAPSKRRQGKENAMPRLTITLSEERQRAVKEAAARRGTTITAIIDESLEMAGIRTRESARQILARAGRDSGLTEEQAMALALRETAADRAERHKGS